MAEIRKFVLVTPPVADAPPKGTSNLSWSVKTIGNNASRATSDALSWAGEQFTVEWTVKPRNLIKKVRDLELEEILANNPSRETVKLYFSKHAMLDAEHLHSVQNGKLPFFMNSNWNKPYSFVFFEELEWLAGQYEKARLLIPPDTMGAKFVYKFLSEFEKAYKSWDIEGLEKFLKPTTWTYSNDDSLYETRLDALFQIDLKIEQWRNAAKWFLEELSQDFRDWYAKILVSTCIEKLKSQSEKKEVA